VDFFARVTPIGVHSHDERLLKYGLLARVMPAKAGIQPFLKILDPRFRGGLPPT